MQVGNVLGCVRIGEGYVVVGSRRACEWWLSRMSIFLERDMSVEDIYEVEIEGEVCYRLSKILVEVKDHRTRLVLRESELSGRFYID